MITAHLSQEWMYRGGDFTLVVQIIMEPTGEAYVIPPDGEVKLRLAQTSAHQSSALELEPEFYSREAGIVHFKFAARDTKDLPAIAYDLTIHLNEWPKVYPVYKGRFALVDFNPEVSETPSPRRNVELLIRRVREELRADGPDGAGYSDFIIMDAINSALDDLSGIFTIRDQVEFTTEEGVIKYDLEEVLGIEVVDIIRVDYDGTRIPGKQIDPFMDTLLLGEGKVREWFLWGKQLTLVGKVEAGKTIKLWITRPPKRLRLAGDTPETPSYADEAIIAYAISVCYRESKDYDRANFHYSVYVGQKGDLLRKAVPQMQKDSLPVMRDSYAGPFRQRRGFVRTDRNPGGRYE